MKKVLLVLVAVLAISAGAFAQRQSDPYVGIGLATNFRSAEEGKTGPAISAGFRNYNRGSFLSVGYGAELFGYYVPSKQASSFGAFANPEIGLAIGPSIFKVYLHTGFMLGYDTSVLNNLGNNGAFGWGGKNGVSFDFGRLITLDFSTYVPRYKFADALYGVNLIVRFGR